MKKHQWEVTNINQYLLLFLSPISALLNSLIKIKYKNSWHIIFIVLVLYGLTMDFKADSYREANMFIEWSHRNIKDFFTYLKNLYIDEKAVDLVQITIMFLVSRFTNNANIYFGIIASIFAYFYLKSIKSIYTEYSRFKNKNSLIYLWFFTFLLPVFYISGSRWAIATWVFFWGAYNFIKFNKIKYLIISFSSVFIHFSMGSAFLALIIYILLGKRNFVYYILIVISFIIQPKIIQYFPDSQQVKIETFRGVQERVSLYANMNTKNLRRIQEKQLKWYVKYPIQILYYYLIIAIIFTRYIYRSISKDHILEVVFSFCLLLFVIANSLLGIPSGNRFRLIFIMFATTYLIILFSKNYIRTLSKVTLLGLLPMFLYFILEIRRGFDTLNIMLLGPLPISFFEKITLF